MSKRSRRIPQAITSLLALAAIPLSLAAQAPGAQQGGPPGGQAPGGQAPGARGPAAPAGPPLGSPPPNAGNAQQLADPNSPIREFVIGPPYDTLASVRAPGVPQGTIHHFVMASEDSKIYNGVRGRFDRNVAVYIPVGYVPGTPAPFMVLQDGVRADLARVVPVLDNLIAEGRIPALIGVFVDPGPGDGPGSDRGNEYDHVSDRYVTFIETEVLPRITRDYNVRFTEDREGRSTFGHSSGAAAAFTMAWFRPDLYSKVLSYSGTFVNQQRLPDSPYPRGAWEYHQTLIPNSPAKPIRIWFHVSDLDNGNSRAEETAGNWVLANMHMLDALKARGYDYRYVWSLEAGHSDRRVIAQTLPNALEWLWRDYPKDRPPTR